MKKLLKALKIIGILGVILFVCYLVLRIGAVDRKLTEWIGSPTASAASDYRIVIDGFEEALAPEEAPFVYEEDGRLWLLQGIFHPEGLDITPPGVNVSYYAANNDITAQMRRRNHCTVREDGKQMLFLLHNRGIPTLFLADLEEGGATLVATNVDSFLFIEDRVVYATGYDRANQLYVFREGESTLIDSDVRSWVIPEWNAITSLDGQGRLRLHDILNEHSQLLTDGVETVYAETARAVHTAEPTVYCRKADGDYRVTGERAERLFGSYRNEIEELLGWSRDGERQYLFCAEQGTLSCVESGEETRLFGQVGKIYRVFLSDMNREEFIAATGAGVYLLRAQAADTALADTVRILSFEDDYKIYRGNGSLIREHMDIYQVESGHFYIASLSAGSFIVNKSRPESWLNYFSSYLYGLSYAMLSEDGNRVYTPISCDVRPSRTLTPPLVLGDLLVYRTTFDNGEIRCAAALFEGRTRCRDLLLTEFCSKGQVRIEAESMGGEVYFTTYEGDKGPQYSILEKDGTGVQSVTTRKVYSLGYVYEWTEQ